MRLVSFVRKEITSQALKDLDGKQSALHISATTKGKKLRKTKAQQEGIKSYLSRISVPI